jgi:hypothetical protein
MFREQCETCRFHDGWGLCRFNPPAITNHEDWDGTEDPIRWPMVRPTDWCGRFEERPGLREHLNQGVIP